jgi:GT2 family glycosyltransferase
VTHLAVVTVVRGRHRHLEHQHESLARGSRRPDSVVVVAMGDEGVGAVVRRGELADRCSLVELPCDDRLPLARARNLGAATALEAGAELLVFLDVDCLASGELLAGYEHAAALRRSQLLCGPVAYLPKLPDGVPAYGEEQLAAAEPHPVRPAPAAGELLGADDLRLFWSLSFAVDAAGWRRIGGFDESYTGYGGEDTDFGQRAAQVGVRMWWVGGAVAYHQWHPVSDPPVEHLQDIVRNANLFHRRWGWFPMEGWLTAFEREGLARRGAGRWIVSGPGAEGPSGHAARPVTAP